MFQWSEELLIDFDNLDALFQYGSFASSTMKLMILNETMYWSGMSSYNMGVPGWNYIINEKISKKIYQMYVDYHLENSLGL